MELLFNFLRPCDDVSDHCLCCNTTEPPDPECPECLDPDLRGDLGCALNPQPGCPNMGPCITISSEGQKLECCNDDGTKVEIFCNDPVGCCCCCPEFFTPCTECQAGGGTDCEDDGDCPDNAGCGGVSCCKPDGTDGGIIDGQSNCCVSCPDGYTKQPPGGCPGDVDPDPDPEPSGPLGYCCEKMCCLGEPGMPEGIQHYCADDFTENECLGDEGQLALRQIADNCVSKSQWWPYDEVFTDEQRCEGPDIVYGADCIERMADVDVPCGGDDDCEDGTIGSCCKRNYTGYPDNIVYGDWSCHDKTEEDCDAWCWEIVDGAGCQTSWSCKSCEDVDCSSLDMNMGRCCYCYTSPDGSRFLNCATLTNADCDAVEGYWDGGQTCSAGCDDVAEMHDIDCSDVGGGGEEFSPASCGSCYWVKQEEDGVWYWKLPTESEFASAYGSGWETQWANICAGNTEWESSGPDHPWSHYRGDWNWPMRHPDQPENNGCKCPCPDRILKSSLVSDHPSIVDGGIV